jgi:3-oxoadipate enol-lactonase
MLDTGSGPPLVLIPGVQGRWEWMKPAIDALAKEWRVIACSLPGEPGSPFPERGGDFNALVGYVDDVLDAAGVETAVVCGISFGGLIALRFAARHPERVRALILVSTPGPHWRPDTSLARYMKWPTLTSPLFFLGGIPRFLPELRATYPEVGRRIRFCADALSRVFSAPGIPSRMSRRAKLAAQEQFDGDCAAVTSPTLIVAGERELDRVVRHDETLEYATRIGGARAHVFARTGHLGCVSDPERFREIVSRFAGILAANPELTHG